MKKWFRKQDEMERQHTTKAVKNAFLFYVVCLLGWSIYNQVKNAGDGGMPFTIMICGVAVYFWTLVYYKRKTE